MSEASVYQYGALSYSFKFHDSAFFHQKQNNKKRKISFFFLKSNLA